MRHQIKYNVDAEGISDPFGIAVEISLVLPLPFSSIADVAVMDRQNHHPFPIIE